MDILVGYTGFVGQNLYVRHEFNGAFNSQNIKDAYCMKPGLCVYSGVRSEKYRADSFPEEDLTHIKDTIENIKWISPNRLALISTVDVIPAVQNGDVYEDTPYDTGQLTPYGKNRLYLENEVRNLFSDALIVRLPALFGQGLKKNFIYDMIHYVPATLRESKFKELSTVEGRLKRFYEQDPNGFFRLKSGISQKNKNDLKNIFRLLGFSALNFTDSRSKYSFYNLRYLWNHIQALMAEGISLAHMATEPTLASELYRSIYGADFINKVSDKPFDYSFFKTRYASMLNGKDGYIFTKNQVTAEIIDYIIGMEGEHA